MLHKALISGLVSCPILFYGLVGIVAYAWTMSEGDTYCPVCVWLASGMWIPRMLWAGKVGLSGLPVLWDLTHLAIWV